MSDVRAGGAYVEIYLKDKFRGQLATMGNQFRSVGNTLATAFAVGSSVGIAALTSFGMFADDIADMAGRLQIGAESLQGLGFAATQTGSNLGDVEKGLRNVSKLVGQAEQGNQAAIKTLQMFGLSFQELAGLTPDEQLKKVADVIASLPDQASKTAAAMKIFGKAGASLLPMLEGGAAGIDEYRQQAEKLGLVMKQSDIDAGGKLADTFGTVKQQASALANTIGAALAPSMQYALEVGRGLLAFTIHFVDNNRALVTTIATVTAIIGGLAVASYAASIAFSVASVVAGVYAAASTALGTALAYVTAMEYAAIAPALLIGAAILGAAGIALYAAGIFDGLGTTFGGMWQGVMDMIASGDMQGAWNILTSGLQLAWDLLLINMEIGWIKTKNMILFGAMEIVKQLQSQLGDTLSNGIGLPKLTEAYYATAREGAIKQANLEIDSEIKMEKYDAQLKKAAEARKKFEAEGKKSKGVMPDFSAMGSGVSESGSFVSGGFQASMVRLLGNMGQSIQEKQLKAQEEANEHLEAIEEGLEGMEGAVFS